MELIIRSRDHGGPGSEPVEVVERKGLGHPDSICDGIAEHVCVRLCRYRIASAIVTELGGVVEDAACVIVR